MVACLCKKDKSELLKLLNQKIVKSFGIDKICLFDSVS